MTDSGLNGRRILVVEDEYLIAGDIRDALLAAGATVLGPVPSVAQALDLIGSEPTPDGAMLDINLRGEEIFVVADKLVELGVPFIFATGYDRSFIPDRFAAMPSLVKPIKAPDILAALKPLV